jgi:hypothetical protein
MSRAARGADTSMVHLHGGQSGGMLSAVLQHYARYQAKKMKGGGGRFRSDGGVEDASFSTSRIQEADSVYASSLNGSGIEFLVKDPICRGYLLAFCQECYNAENMLFLIEIEKFRESLKADKALWPGNYKEIDNLIAINPDKVWAWKSRINLESVQQQIRYIYEHFIDKGSEYEICVSTPVLERTNRRVELIAAYGLETFHEISIDPFRTLEKDILPRFVSSRAYHTLCEKLDLITHLPTGDTLVVEPPSEYTDMVMGLACTVDKKFTLDEILATKALYSKFLSHLRTTMSSENLLCKRLILFFLQRMNENNFEEADRIAWDIYRYFVAAHSPYEVSLEYAHKTELKFNLAKPTETMFDALNRSVTSQLSCNFSDFRQTSTYANLAMDLHVDVEQRQKAEDRAKRRGCL